MTAGKQDILRSHKRALHDIAAKLWAAVSKFRRRVRLSFVLGGTALAAFASLAVNFVDEPYKNIAWTLQGVGLFIAFVGGLLLEFVDESAPEALRRAHDAIDVAEENERIINSLDTVPLSRWRKLAVFFFAGVGEL